MYLLRVHVYLGHTLQFLGAFLTQNLVDSTNILTLKSNPYVSMSLGLNGKVNYMCNFVLFFTQRFTLALVKALTAICNTNKKAYLSNEKNMKKLYPLQSI